MSEQKLLTTRIENPYFTNYTKDESQFLQLLLILTMLTLLSRHVSILEIMFHLKNLQCSYLFCVGPVDYF